MSNLMFDDSDLEGKIRQTLGSINSPRTRCHQNKRGKKKELFLKWMNN